MATFKPDWMYVNRRLTELKQRFTGVQTINAELEALRYFENQPSTEQDQQFTGFNIHIGLFSELVENVKAALTSQNPIIRVEAQKKSQEAETNANNREKFWAEFIDWASNPSPFLNEVVDAQAGLTYGILKAGKTKWSEDLKRRRNESNEDYLDRARAVKRKEGPCFALLSVHPNGVYFELGPGNQLSEVIEDTFKPMLDIYQQYGSKYFKSANSNNLDVGSQAVPPNWADTDRADGEIATMVDGIPNETVRGMPDGWDSTTSVQVTEYWNSRCYQVWINGTLIYEESPPSVRYIIVPGRTTSSKDPSKFSLSIGEILRHNEPVLDRMFSRMAEATDLVVKKRLTVQFESGYSPSRVPDGKGNMVPETFTFKPDAASSLPEGAKVVDPFEGVDKVFAGLPVIELFLQIMARHSVNPIFKGIPPGAAGSGYRDNSLYLMARSQFNYMITSLEQAGKATIEFLEWLIVNKVKQEVWCGEYCLKPEDIANYPATIHFEVKPDLPQNNIANGTFMDRMHSQGHITRHRVRSEIGIEQPSEEEFARDLEDLFEMAKPMVFQDVLAFVYGGQQQQVTNSEGQGLVDSSGQNPLMSSGGPGGFQQLMSQKTNGGGRGLGREMGGYATQGLARQQPGSASIGVGNG